MDGSRRFTWYDGERTIRFGRGVAGEAVGVLGGPGYALLTTARARGAAPEVVEAAATVLEVAPGQVDELAGELLGTIEQDRIVALGGGRVVDVAKALAGASLGAARAMAIPTTLSGAEMTRVHRQAAGAPEGAANVRPAVVVNDPALSASQPEPELAASALNALGHAAEGPCTPRANPVSTLAVAALLAGYTSDATVYGRQHVLAQTLVQLGRMGHSPAKAIMLPHSLGALAWRFPAWIERLSEAMGGDPAEVAQGLCARTGATRLGELGVDAAALDACADAAAERPELGLTPPRADRAELRALYGDAL